MVGSASSAASRFYSTNAGASAHYGVLKNGDIWHWVDEDNTAYHAGNYPMNQRSVGIEHEDNGMVNGIYDDGPRPDALYTTSANLVRDICKFYNIPIDRIHILKHSEVSDKPTACPDALDIDRIVREANGDPSQQTLIDQLRADRDKNWNLYQGALNKQIELESAVEAKNKTIDSLTKDNQTKQAMIDDMAIKLNTDLKTISDLTDEVDKTSTEFIQEQSEHAKTMRDLESCQKSKLTLSSATKKQLFDEWFKRIFGKG